MKYRQILGNRLNRKQNGYIEFWQKWNLLCKQFDVGRPYVRNLPKQFIDLALENANTKCKEGLIMKEHLLVKHTNQKLKAENGLALLLGSDYSPRIHGFSQETVCQLVQSFVDHVVLKQAASEGVIHQ